MGTFGRFDPGGRSAPRTNAGLVAVLLSGTGEYSSTLIDVSRTGMLLRGDGLPPEGEDVLILTEDVRVWGQVVRSEVDVCAVEFDTPLASVEVKRLRSHAGHAGD